MSILHLGLMEDSEIDLDIAALELAGLDHPDADLEDQIDTLAAIEQDLAKIADRAKTTAERAGALATILAEDHGFSGDRQRYCPSACRSCTSRWPAGSAGRRFR
jgi:regulator of sirC expression with transglutaminase-like and TPR domain